VGKWETKFKRNIIIYLAKVQKKIRL
jgi:hypothetical protein